MAFMTAAGSLRPHVSKRESIIAERVPEESLSFGCSRSAWSDLNMCRGSTSAQRAAMSFVAV
jgi:hypothetical protein